MSTWRASEPGDTTDVPVGADYIRENNDQVELVCGATRLADGTPIPDYIPVGGTSAMWFYLDAQPVGWTEVLILGDTLLAIKGGATYTTGGAAAGDWTLPDHTLIEAEIPAHIHTYSSPDGPEGKRRTGDQPCVTSRTTGTATGSTGGGGSHSHGSTYRPAARVGIICTKD